MPGIDILVETGRRRTFACALDWPGLARAGKAEEHALLALLEAIERYRPVARRAGVAFPVGTVRLNEVERLPGGAGTDFGVPSVITVRDRQPVDAAEADRQARLVAACWAEFDAVAARSPAELRKGPRGGGRDRGPMIAHVVESDAAYSRNLGARVAVPAPGDAAAVAAMREGMLAVLRQPSDGSPLAGKKWPARFAARYIAWHALGHAWEMEDRSRPVEGRETPVTGEGSD